MEVMPGRCGPIYRCPRQEPGYWYHVYNQLLGNDRMRSLHIVPHSSSLSLLWELRTTQPAWEVICYKALLNLSDKPIQGIRIHEEEERTDF